jgi:hypothetical protein
VRGVNFFILLFILSLLTPTQTTLQAKEIDQEIILSIDKNKTKVLKNLVKIKDIFSNNIEAKFLYEKHKIKSKIVKYGTYNTITISPIETIAVKKTIVLLLEPYFDDIFIINNDVSSLEKSEEKNIDTYIQREMIQTTLMQESLEKINKDKVKEYTIKTHMWLDKWHALIVMTLLGIFFYYRRLRKLSEIKMMQDQLTEEQNRVEIQIRKIKR